MATYETSESQHICESAAGGTVLLADALAGLISLPLITIETVEQAVAARQEGLAAPELAPTIASEVATPVVHAMLDWQHRTMLDGLVCMLDASPRARPHRPPRVLPDWRGG